MRRPTVKGLAAVAVKRSVDMEEVTTPEVSDTVENQSEEERPAIFQRVFSTHGEPVATVNCSAATPGQDTTSG